MLGGYGIVVDRLAPSGYIQVGGELWKAEATQEFQLIEKGRSVQVVGIRGLTLLVKPDDGER
jgi:membrane-bound ClpP family serine protease